MLFTKYLTLALAGLVAARGKGKMKKKIWEGNWLNLDNRAALAECIKDLHERLDGETQIDFHDGYTCADSTFESGSKVRWTNGWNQRDVVRKCEPQLHEAAGKGQDWFHCLVYIEKMKKEISVGWAPLGKRLCEMPGDHKPCSRGLDPPILHKVNKEAGDK